MYDRITLKASLERAGFREVRVCSADSSRIEGFADFQLDSMNGKVRKPDSLFVEAMKPLVDRAALAGNRAA